jgi:hypothetical protein
VRARSLFLSLSLSETSVTAQSQVSAETSAARLRCTAQLRRAQRCAARQHVKAEALKPALCSRQLGAVLLGAVLDGSTALTPGVSARLSPCSLSEFQHSSQRAVLTLLFTTGVDASSPWEQREACCY